MRSSRLLFAAVAAALVVSALAGPATAATVVMGKGFPPWKIGQKRVVKPGLIRSEAHPENGGCVGGLGTANRIDYYPYWTVGSVGGSIFNVATTRRGDRSSDGFVIGGSRFKAVRHKHPRAYVASAGDDPYALGSVSLSINRSTGYESGMGLTYWFRDGGLVALQTGIGGC